MTPLAEFVGKDLSVGDILCLPDRYDLDVEAGPLDLMVYDPQGNAGLGLVVVSGDRAGVIHDILPLESRGETGGLSVDWLTLHWEEWFVFSYAGQPAVAPCEGTYVLNQAHRDLVHVDDKKMLLDDISVDFVTVPKYLPHIKSLLSRDPGRVYRLDEVAPDFDLHSENLRVSWIKLTESDWMIAIVMMHAETLDTHVTMHTSAFLEDVYQDHSEHAHSRPA